MNMNKQALVSSTYVAENLIVIITVVASILCLVPLMVAAGSTTPSSSPHAITPSTNTTTTPTTTSSPSSLTDQPSTTDDDAWFYATNDFLQNLSGFFYVVLVPVVDIALEVPGWLVERLTHHCHNINRSSPTAATPAAATTAKISPNATKSTIVRLSEIERFLFIFGIAIMSSASFIAPTQTEVDVYTVYDCSSDFSAVMTIGPLVSFLVRATTACTPLRGVLIVLCVALGGLFDSYQVTTDDDTAR